MLQYIFVVVLGGSSHSNLHLSLTKNKRPARRARPLLHGCIRYYMAAYGSNRYIQGLQCLLTGYIKMTWPMATLII